jgi:integrase
LPNDAGLHALRHTFLTHAGKLTQNVKALQLLAGHAQVTTTMKYIHPHESDILGIVAAMEVSGQPNTKAPVPPAKKAAQTTAGD